MDPRFRGDDEDMATSTIYMQSQRLLKNQGVGAKTAHVQSKFIRRWAVWLIAVTMLALFYVWSRIQVVQYGYENATLTRQSDELSKQISSLEIEIAKLKSPARLEDVAKKELGMRPPSAEQTVIVK